MRPGSSFSHKPQAEKEKQRRDRMKDLYSTLATMLHLEPYESKSLPEFLDRATTSLIHLKERVEKLKVTKEELEKEVAHNDEPSNSEQRLKVVRVTESMDQKLEVNMIFMVSNKKVGPFEVLRVIEQGGAEITSSSFSTVGHHVYCTIHAKVHIIF
ncbi:putative transcription factor bHLH family [Helianthus annuus]|uniref:uncharacterized protein LOC118486453 n=1 Tax=Helianthus annuus TaxID=4232 RepID=UPI0016530027|nr:uncharacterized protein LOC118486453 [Helianthus annuus]KAJ0462943.1 putative transcription factor bHLH family [Helianthus annuus]KAJ0484301.1 putative transcription factor bHLH family [Helianthus annuus]KAJ0658591.1 putative transcription factor bHLH family [Helianthus annuus]